MTLRAAHTLNEGGKHRLTLAHTNNFHAQALTQGHEARKERGRLNLFSHRDDSSSVRTHPCARTVPTPRMSQGKDNWAV